MKNKIKTVLLIIITFVLGVAFSMKFISGSSAEDTAVHSEREHKEETLWTCSMHPQIKLPEEGDCPICGMDLIPLETENNGEGEIDFSLSAYAEALAQVETTPVRFEKPELKHSFLGELSWDERTVKTQSAWFGGRIEKLHTAFIGQKVKRGKAIASLYSPELYSAAEEWRQAKAAGNERMISSVRKKLELMGLNKNEIKRLNSVKSARFVQRASVSGVVTKINASEGNYLKRGQPVITVAQTKTLWAQVEIYEKDIHQVSVGDSVLISLPNSFKKFKGKIVFIDPVVDSKKRISRARIEIDNREGHLKPGMLIEAEIEKTADKEMLLVPAASLLFTGERAVLYRKIGLSYELLEVDVGARFGDLYAVMGDLSAGDLVVSRGAFKIDAARQIMALPSMMYPDGDAPADMAGHNHGGTHKKDHEMKDQDTNDFNKSTVKMKSSHSNGLTKSEKEWLSELYSIYLELQKTLYTDNLPEGVISSQKLMKPLMSPPKKFETAEEREVMMKLHSINDKSDLKDLRGFFLPLSSWFIKTIEQNRFTPEQGGSVYYCPMADGNKGAEWIQKDGGVLNPYFGKMMLTCGEQRRSLPDKN